MSQPMSVSYLDESPKKMEEEETRSVQSILSEELKT